MDVGRERCNLNKNLFFPYPANNWQKQSSQANSVRAVLELFSHMLQNINPIY